MIGPAANLIPEAPSDRLTVVVANAVDASAAYDHLPDDLMSNTSTIGAWNAVLRLMCSVPSTSSMVRSTFTCEYRVLTTAPFFTYGPTTNAVPRCEST